MDRFDEVKEYYLDGHYWLSIKNTENIKWLIAEVERLRETLRRLEPEKSHICGNCGHWRCCDPPTGSVGDCSGREEFCSTFSDFRCDVDAWTTRHPKPETEKLHICGTCGHWAFDHSNRESGWCYIGTQTGVNYYCNIGSWISKKPKTKLPDPFFRFNIHAEEIRDTINAIIDYLKAKEKEDV